MQFKKNIKQIENVEIICKFSEHVQNPPAFKIYPVKFENRLPIEGKG